MKHGILLGLTLALAAAGCVTDDDDDAQFSCVDACSKVESCMGAQAWTVCMDDTAKDNCTGTYRCQAACINQMSCDSIEQGFKVDSGPLSQCLTDCAKNAPRPDTCYKQPMFLDKDVDILFVVDNSNSMDHEQKNLKQNFPKLIDALRSNKLGGKLPNVRIGVISTDLGAGKYNLPSCELTGGDAGKLWNKPQIAGCQAPKDKWIEYNDGKHNITGATGDPITAVKSAFQCIAQIGLQGCGFEQTLESSRRALDPALNVNPGFLRNDPKSGKDALLAVVYITDEDDCSAAKDTLYDPAQQGLTDPLGPLTSFRCFEFGVTCQCNGGQKCDRTTTGPRKNCVPGGSEYMKKVEDYITFFRNLKKTADGKPNPDRVIMAAIAGSTLRVEVGVDGTNPTLKPSCQTAEGFAVPGIRIQAVVHAFARQLTGKELAEVKQKKTNIPYWIDKSGLYREENFTTICTPDFSPALKRIGERIVASLGTMCLPSPPVAAGGGVACYKGDVLGVNSKGQQVVCQNSCLDQTDFKVEQITTSGRTKIPRCAASDFNPSVSSGSCSTCPCWRIVPSATCKQATGYSPYALEIMRKGDGVKGTYASVCGGTVAPGWGTPELADMTQCN